MLLSRILGLTCPPPLARQLNQFSCETRCKTNDKTIIAKYVLRFNPGMMFQLPGYAASLARRYSHCIKALYTEDKLATPSPKTCAPLTAFERIGRENMVGAEGLGLSLQQLLCKEPSYNLAARSPDSEHHPEQASHRDPENP